MRKRAFLVALATATTLVAILGGPAVAGKPGTGVVREARLSGAEVVPPPGDPDGAGLARLILYPNKNKICTTMSVSGIGTPTVAHLHKAPVGQEGPVTLKLSPPEDGTSEHECIRGLGERFIKKISGNPADYYVDVHNDGFPGGAVRGQLSR